MKASGKNLLSIAAVIIVVNLIATVLFDQAILPLLPGNGGGLAWDLAAHAVSFAFFLIGVLVSCVVVALCSRTTGRLSVRQDVIDAISRPILILDESKRPVLFNREAERVLGLSRERDVGAPLERELEKAVFSKMPGDSDSGIVIRSGQPYRAREYALPDVSGAIGRSRMVILDDASDMLRIREAIQRFQRDLGLLGTNTVGIANASQSLFDGATKQAGSLSAISSSLDEFSRKIQGNTEAASKGTVLAAQAREAAERSGSEIAHALSAMTDVQDAGVRIARIVKLIDDIAFQTNLLALNAAVEAARAGRQGKGFAVVADEVRNLAGRSAKAAKDTAVMVEDVTERIGNASAYISKLEEMLRNIMQDAVRMADSSTAASEISVEQSSAILQVNHELAQMNVQTQKTKAEAEKTVSAVKELANLIDSLKQQFGQTRSDLGLDTTIEQRELSADSSAYERPEPFEPEPPYRHSYSTSSATHNDSFMTDLDDDNPFSNTSEHSHPQFAKPNPNDTIPLPDVDSSDFSEDDFVAPFKRMAALRDLQDSIAEQQNTTNGPTSGLPEYSTNKDGDRVVRPGQQIHLDDSEFGRY